ncbi:MAG: PaaI family thioesterase [Alphaproteobacteria bacterium]
MSAAIPPGFGALPRISPYVEAMGPFYGKAAEGGGRILGLAVLEKHINTRGFVHGGVLCSLADIAIGYSVAFGREPPLPLVTAHLSIDFAGNAKLGDWIECRVDVQRVGGRLAFANAYIWKGEERIVRASAIFARADAPKD